MLATITSKGQVTIPKEIRERLSLRSQDKIDFVIEGDRVVLLPVKTLLDLRGAVKPRGGGDFEEERGKAKLAVAARVAEEEAE
ncbi:AbrB/MazE/SpoVT family DNA-binding domain-containing protein [Geomonas sp. Red32]|uniref:AbrB/MazE/SpoVT family DNA-binding domain-containing protein n=1 Tax=Geomonas sp. Red32 TaxID=2912856 RepID=UPI00202CFBE5|nr:AbrB/MazE/SpoVT family DNA-binding domain-containing protein [Geomonas sp. Red32]MCM0082375.1 AbrB/MazE/SpoVT family DNA-binding domain-containing protein [Geomonas sp. Red32]